METHTPYAPPPDALEHVMNGAPHPDLPSVNVAATVGHLQPIDAELQASIRKAYDATVYDLDRHLRALFQALDEGGFLDHAVVVLTADHGEEFADHGGMGHGKTLYNEVVHVPLIILTPGEDAGRVVETVTPLVDVAPTVLDLAGIRVPKTFAGQSVCSLLGDVRCANPPVAAEGTALSELQSNANIDRPVVGPHRHALVVGDDKVLTGPDEVQFYDLAVDPRERDPNAFDEPTRHALRERLTAMVGEASENPATPDTRPIDDETRERLRALGYAD
jgi:arylsulfatase A-like enzyme